jgi:hypothetical protein
VTTAAPRPGTGRGDWLDEGLRLVASLGTPALTLDRICERMALTKGAVSEITSARHDKIYAHLRAADLGALADLGFVGLDDDPDDPVIVTGYKRTRQKKLTEGQKQANQLIAATRAPNEHGFAALKNWRILTRLRLNPARATMLLRALLLLTNLETTRYTTRQTINPDDHHPRPA